MNVKIFAHSGKSVEEAKQKVLDQILMFLNLSEANVVLINYQTEIVKNNVIAEAIIYYEINNRIR